jgi:hypothetical protein
MTNIILKKTLLDFKKTFKKDYIQIMTCDKFVYPPFSKEQAMIQWQEIDNLYNEILINFVKKNKNILLDNVKIEKKLFEFKDKFKYKQKIAFLFAFFLKEV